MKPYLIETQLETKTRVKTQYLVLGVIATGFLAVITTIYLPRGACESLSENACQSQNSCQAIYAQDKKFLRCITLSQESLQENKRQKELCSSTGGKWEKIEFGRYCDCSSQGKYFRAQLGCQ